MTKPLAGDEQHIEHIPLQLVSTAEFEQLTGELNLTKEQRHELYVQLQHFVEDLKAHERRIEERGPKDELTDRLEKVGKAMDNLLYEIDRNKHLMSKFMPGEALQAIGEMLSYSAIEDALGSELPRVDIKRDLYKTDLTTARMADIDKVSQHQRQTAGLKSGPDLLEYMIKRIHAPIARRLEEAPNDTGGRPINHMRRLLFVRMVTYCAKVLAVVPTGTAAGTFARLCDCASRALGVSTDGLERAIDYFLYPPKRIPSSKGNGDA
jgi:hypothetical protein